MFCQRAEHQLARGPLRSLHCLQGPCSPGVLMWRSLAGVAVFCLLPRQGPAVWALRAQTDKLEYSRTMRSILEQEPNLHLREVRRQAMGSWFSGPQHMHTYAGAVLSASA